jgi:hypothetical protein
MEPTGTYGDGLRALLVSRGVSVFMQSPKRVHDAREVFDWKRSSRSAGSRSREARGDRRFLAVGFG